MPSTLAPQPAHPEQSATAPGLGSSPQWSKVPEVTLLFWVIKILTTGMGEITSDYLVHTIAPVVAVGIGFIGFAAALGLQLRAPRYREATYWLAVVMVSVFGTMAADVTHVQFKVPYIASTVFFSAALAVIFAAWHRVERTLSIHSIFTRRRELFYWLVVLTTFALGTAAGDLTAITLHLGFLTSGVVFAGVFAVPALLYWRRRLNPIAAFWLAYIVTRPLGASFADWMGLPTRRGGLDWGTGPVSLTMGVIIALLVGYLAVRSKPTAVAGKVAGSGA